MSNDHDKNSVLRLITWLFLVFVVLVWLITWLGFTEHTGFNPETIAQGYLGKTGPFGGTAPRSYRVMLELAHSHLFAYGVLLFILTHLLYFVPMSKKIKSWLVVVIFCAPLLSEASGWLVRYVHPAFAYLKIAMFVVFQLSLATVVVLLSRVLMRGGALSHAPGPPKK